MIPTEGLKVKKSSGSSQLERVLVHHQPLSLSVDDRSFEELLVYGKQIAAGIRFPVGGLIGSSSWLPLFDKNPVVIVASISTLDIQKIKKQFDVYRDKDVDAQYRFLIGWFKTINRWHFSLECCANDWTVMFTEKLERLIESVLKTPAQNLRQSLMSRSVSKDITENVSFSEFHGVWKLNINIDTKIEVIHESSDVYLMLDDCYRQLQKGLSFLQSLAAQYPQSLLYSKNNDPALGLFMAFLKLYKHPQNLINTFALREKEFYYESVLKEKPKDGEYHNAYLSILPVAGYTHPIVCVNGALVLPGHKLPLNKVEYSVTSNNFQLSHSQPASLLFCDFEKDPMILPSASLGYSTGISCSSLPLLKASELTDIKDPCGELLVKKGVIADSVFGFAIESRELWLAEGKRCVTLKFSLSDMFIDLTSVNAPESPTDIKNSRLVDALSAGDAISSSICMGLALRQLRINDQKFDNYCSTVCSSEVIDKITSDEFSCPIDQFKSLNPIAVEMLLYQIILVALIQEATTSNQLSFPLGRLNRCLLFSQSSKYHIDLKKSDVDLINNKIDLLFLPDEVNAIKSQFALNDSGSIAHVQDCFVIKISTLSGWENIKNAEFSVGGDSNAKPGEVVSDYCLSVEFTLDDTFPAVTQPIEVMNLGIDGIAHPVLQMLCNQSAHIHPLDLFDGLQIVQLDVLTEVTGINDFIVYDNHGEIEKDMPYKPFGSQLESGRNMVFGAYELAQKTLTSINLNIEWSSIPSGSLTTYYGGPSILTDNCNVIMSTLSEGSWTQLNNNASPSQGEYPLFTIQSDTCVDKKKSFQYVCLKDAPIGPIESSTLVNEFEYQTNTRRGFFRLSLDHLPTGCGYQEYLNLVSSVMASNSYGQAHAVTGTEYIPKPIPKSPYNPTVSSSSIDYSSSVSYSINATPIDIHQPQCKIFHLSPFGYNRVHPSELGQFHHKATTFLPQEGDGHSVYIGFLGDTPCGIVSLYLQFDKISAACPVGNRQLMHWSYLSKNQWTKFNQDEIISDGTEGLQRSGNVILNIPYCNRGPDLDANGTSQTRMPKRLFWIKISSQLPILGAKYLKHVAINVIKVGSRQVLSERQGVSSHPVLGKLYKPEMYKDWNFKSSIPGVDKIIQMGETFGSIDTENTAEFHARVSERLRHKNRAVTAWDFEHLVLERFPQIKYAQCFRLGSLTDNQRAHLPESIAMANILLVVANHKSECNHQPCNSHDLSQSEIYEIQNYLQSLCSPFVKISVINPFFESVSISCSVTTSGNLSQKSQQQGVMIKTITDRVMNYICPWSSEGQNKKLGWVLDREALKSEICQLDFVSSVPDLELCSKYSSDNIPWRLWMPASVHNISLMSSSDSASTQEPVLIKGIGKNTIGVNLIIN